MVKKFWLKFWPAIIITIVIFAFHSRLFLPHLSFYTTPDYGRSDAISLSLANKFYYAQELKQNRIPIWNPNIATGYPTLAEGQTAIFFLPNLILFRFLPFALAYSLSLVLSFLLAGWGIYLFTRSLGLSKLASVFAGTVFPLGGFFVFHVQHHNLLQTASIMPWLFWQVEEFIKNKKYKNLLYFSLLLSQQFFAGFPQITFYSLVGISLYIGLKHFLEEKKSLIFYFLITLAIFLGISLAAIQIGPSYEFLQNSSKSSDPKQILEQFPFFAKNLLLLLDPFFLGSPKNGTYPIWIPNKWGIFWESQAYIGIIPLIFAIAISTAAVRLKNQNTKNAIYIFTTLAFFTIILSIGKQSPTHVLYSIPPFSFFRVPSRFLLLTQFSLIILATYFVNKINNKFIVLTIISVTVINIYFRVGYYNPSEKAASIINPPKTAIFLNTINHSNIISIGDIPQWNDVFVKKGWENNLNYFSEARNFLNHNSNLLYNTSSAHAYESILTKRYASKYSLFLAGQGTKNGKITLTDPAVKVINSNNISHIITTRELEGDGFKKIYEIKENSTYNIYENKNDYQKYFVTNKYLIADSIPRVLESFSKKDFDLAHEVVLENDPKQTFDEKPNYQIYELEAKSTYTKLQVNSSANEILVVNESFYPGWIASIDGKKTDILPANINSRAIVIPGGNHIVEFFYKSKTITNSALISFVSLAFVALALIKAKNKNLSN